jgi:myo-inositol-1(or 4)-monophosphatase
MNPLSTQVLHATEAARLAASTLRHKFGNIKHITHKSNDRGIVTEADEQAESRILDYLSANTPYSILSEEAGAIHKAAGPVWVIDPLDGTTNFAQGLPLFVVSIALVELPQVLAGVIINPISGEEYVAELGKGLYKNGAKLNIDHSAINKIPTIFINHGYSFKDRNNYSELCTRLAPISYLRTLGASALELAHLANGRADAFICPGDELWDIAAGIGLAKEAGYKVTDWNGKPWDNTNSYVLVSRPQLHEKLLKLISDITT